MPIGRKKKALVHIAKRDLGLDQTSYQQILRAVAGVESAAELNEEGFERVMARFQEMGFKGLLPSPFHPMDKGRLIPVNSHRGEEPITVNQQRFAQYLLERLQWDDGHYRSFCRRIIKRPEPLTKRDGQKIIIGLLAVIRHRARQRRQEGKVSGSTSLS